MLVYLLKFLTHNVGLSTNYTKKWRCHVNVVHFEVTTDEACKKWSSVFFSCSWLFVVRCLLLGCRLYWLLKAGCWLSGAILLVVVLGCLCVGCNYSLVKVVDCRCWLFLTFSRLWKPYYLALKLMCYILLLYDKKLSLTITFVRKFRTIPK